MSARLSACFAFSSSELFFEFQEIGEVHVLKKKKKSQCPQLLSLLLGSHPTGMTRLGHGSSLTHFPVFIALPLRICQKAL